MIASLLLSSVTVTGKKVYVYEQIPSSRVSAQASSAIGSSPAANAVNGKGMLGDAHVANNLGEGMWVSEVSKNKVRYDAGTRQGAVWFLCVFDEPLKIEQLLVWNHNQNEKTVLETSLSSPQGVVRDMSDVPAARKWTVAFFPHSHQDIGYTHRQNDVMKLQWRNLERAMSLAERTRDYPDGARYKWNTEATWSIKGYLDKYAGTPKADRVIEAIKNGAISSLRLSGQDFEYASSDGLNTYHYSGHRSTDPVTDTPVRSIALTDNGPVSATLRIESDAPGCNSLIRDITLYRGLQRVDIVNTLDKQDIRKKENVRFVFPFNFPHPDIAIDLAMSEMHPEREQLSGVNKHYYSLQNGLSVGDLEHGICLTSVDAPFVEFGSTSGEDYRLNPRHGYGWWRMAQISPVVYSWVMTNTWGTNYKASQGGPATFRYTLEPGDPHDLCLKQRGQEREHPLVAFRSESSAPADCLFRLKGNHKIAVSGITPAKDNSGYIVSLHNMDKEAVCTAFEWRAMQGVKVDRCDWRQQPLSSVNHESFWLRPYEYAVLKVTVK